VTDQPGCARWAEFVAIITYTSDSSESEDDASFRVRSNFTTIDADKLDDFGVSEGALLGDNDDLAIRTATAALPVLVADAGLAPPVTAEPATATSAGVDHLTGRPGSDFMRTYAPMLVAAAVSLVAGVALLSYLLLFARRRPRPSAAASSTPGAPSPPSDRSEPPARRHPDPTP
jgi:hypothetical protein